MYRSYYGLLRSPFEIAPDPNFLYLGDTHREALATLVYGVRARKDFVLLTGAEGIGKTTLIHALLSQLEKGLAAAFIFNPKIEPLDFFRLLLDEFGIDSESRTAADSLLELNRFLVARSQKAQPALLIIDEAQDLSLKLFEEIRLLLNLETPESKLIQVILIGSPNLNEILARDDLQQLRQRIVLRYHLDPFTEEETARYVEARLRLAGLSGKEIFTKAALKEIHAATGGVPRSVNLLCHSALALGCSREIAEIGSAEILEAAADMQLETSAVFADAEGGSREVPERGQAKLFGLLK